MKMQLTMKKNIPAVNIMHIVCLLYAFCILSTPVISRAQANCEYDSAVTYGQSSYNGDVSCVQGASTSQNLSNTGQRYLVAGQIAASVLIAGTAAFLLFTRVKKKSS